MASNEIATKEKTNKFGVILGIVMGFLGIIGFIAFFLWNNDGFPNYETIIQTEIDRNNGCGPIIVYFYPIFTDLGIIAGILWLISSLGFLNHKEWAFKLAVIANVFSLKSSFWPNIPAMESSASPPLWFLIFLINLAVYFVLLRSIGKIPWFKILIGLGMGMCFILCFINGIAATQRMVFFTRPERTMYILTERINFIASLGWGVSILGLLLTRKEWIKWIAIGSALLGAIGGFLVAIANATGGSKFSMFFVAPVMCLLLLLINLWPSTWKKIMNYPNK